MGKKGRFFKSKSGKSAANKLWKDVNARRLKRQEILAKARREKSIKQIGRVEAGEGPSRRLKRALEAAQSSSAEDSSSGAISQFTAPKRAKLPSILKKDSQRVDVLQNQNNGLKEQIEYLKDLNSRLETKMQSLNIENARIEERKKSLEKEKESYRLQLVTERKINEYLRIDYNRLELRLKKERRKVSRAKKGLKKKSTKPKIPKLEALEDLIIFHNFTTKARRQLKHDLLYNFNLNFLAPTDKVADLSKKLTSLACFEEIKFTAAGGKDKIAYYCINVREIIEHRLTRLAKAKKLILDGHFRNRIFLCATGDKGADTVKFGVLVENVLKVNSPYNLIILGIFDAEENRVNLEAAFSGIFKDIEQITEVTFEYKSQIVSKKVEWFFTSDMKFTAYIYGHCAHFAMANSCVLCACPRNEYGKNVEWPLRELTDMEDSARIYRATGSLHLSEGFVRPPLIDIGTSSVVPSALHIMQGIFQCLYKLTEDEATLEEKKKMDQECQKLGVKRQAFQSRCFTGNHVRTLLTKSGPKSITDCIPNSPKRQALFSLMTTLGEIQSFSKASFLEEDEIDKLKSSIDKFFNLLRNTFPNISITPKIHWLRSHIVPFVRRHHFWGLFSEQPIEATHRIFNQDYRQFCGIKKIDKIRRKQIQQNHLRNAIFDLPNTLA